MWVLRFSHTLVWLLWDLTWYPVKIDLYIRPQYAAFLLWNMVHWFIVYWFHFLYCISVMLEDWNQQQNSFHDIHLWSLFVLPMDYFNFLQIRFFVAFSFLLTGLTAYVPKQSCGMFPFLTCLSRNLSVFLEVFCIECSMCARVLHIHLLCIDLVYDWGFVWSLHYLCREWWKNIWAYICHSLNLHSGK